LPYSIDTSGLVDGRRRYYPPSVFQGLWEDIEDLIQAGGLFASDEVFHDLERQDDDVHAWAATQPALFLPLDHDIQVATTEVMTIFNEWVPVDRSRNVADPFVVAVARVRQCPVVSGEKWSNSPYPSRVAIPNVCQHFGLRHMTFLEMIQDLRWTYGR
jgi:hypothetical protein